MRTKTNKLRNALLSRKMSLLQSVLCRLHVLTVGLTDFDWIALLKSWRLSVRVDISQICVQMCEDDLPRMSTTTWGKVEVNSVIHRNEHVVKRRIHVS